MQSLCKTHLERGLILPSLTRIPGYELLYLDVLNQLKAQPQKDQASLIQHDTSAELTWATEIGMSRLDNFLKKEFDRQKYKNTHFKASSCSALLKEETWIYLWGCFFILGRST